MGGGGGGGGGGDSREERVRAKAEREKQRFLTLQAPDSAAAHMNWIKQYEKSRGYCHTWAWKDHGMKDKIEACAKAVNAHYLDLAPVAVQMLIDKGKALQAHWAVRKLGDHSRHRFWNLDSQAPEKLAQTAAKARAEWAQKLYEGSKKYVEPNNMGCVASASPLPKDNGRIAEPVYHVKIGQKLYVRCYFPSTVASVLSGKEGAVLKGEVNTTDQNLSNCKGYECEKDPDLSFHYDMAINHAKFASKDYIDYEINTGASPKGTKVTKDNFGTIELTGSVYWVIKYEKKYNDKTKAVEVVPIYEKAGGTTSISYHN